MLAPQFSLRRLLGWVTASAFVCLIAAAAARGQMGAVAVMVAIFGLVVTIGVHGLLYLVAHRLSQFVDRRKCRPTIAAAAMNVASEPPIT